MQYTTVAICSSRVLRVPQKTILRLFDSNLDIVLQLYILALQIKNLFKIGKCILIDLF